MTYEEAVMNMKRVIKPKEKKVIDTMKVHVCAETGRYVRPRFCEQMLLENSTNEDMLMISGGERCPIPGEIFD